MVVQSSNVYYGTTTEEVGSKSLVRNACVTNYIPLVVYDVIYRDFEQFS